MLDCEIEFVDRSFEELVLEVCRVEDDYLEVWRIKDTYLKVCRIKDT